MIFDWPHKNKNMTYDKKPPNYPDLDSFDKEIIRVLSMMPPDELRAWAQRADKRSVEYTRVLLDRVDLILNPGLMPDNLLEANTMLSKFALLKKPTLWQRLFSKKVK